MTTALEGGKWSAARPGCTIPLGKTQYPFYRRLGGLQGRYGQAENLVHTWIRSQNVQPVVSRYTDWDTQPTLHAFRTWISVLIFTEQKGNEIQWNTYPFVVCLFLGDCPVSEFYILTFRNTLFHLQRPMKMELLHTYLCMKMEQTGCSEMSAYKIQTPGNYPEESIKHSEHSKSLKSRMYQFLQWRAYQ